MSSNPPLVLHYFIEFERMYPLSRIKISKILDCVCDRFSSYSTILTVNWTEISIFQVVLEKFKNVLEMCLFVGFINKFVILFIFKTTKLLNCIRFSKKTSPRFRVTPINDISTFGLLIRNSPSFCRTDLRNLKQMVSYFVMFRPLSR